MKTHSSLAQSFPAPAASALSDPANKKIAVLISGGGTNLQAIIDAIESGALNAEISIVISSRKDALGLERAKQHGIKNSHVLPKDFAERESYDRHLACLIDNSGAKIIVLAGFMHIFSAWFCQQYENKILNIHPALLPKFPGLNTHQRALDAGEKRHGASVHFVTAELDAGPVIIQGAVDVNGNDTAETLQQRVLNEVEHTIYTKAIRWVLEQRLTIAGDSVLLDGARRPEQGINAD